MDGWKTIVSFRFWEFASFLGLLQLVSRSLLGFTKKANNARPMDVPFIGG